MGPKRRLQRTLIERFIERGEGALANRLRPDPRKLAYQKHLRRFMKMVENRKQQILDKMLMD